MYERGLELDSIHGGPDSFEGVAASGGRVYVAMHGSGLAIFDHRSGRFVKEGVVCVTGRFESDAQMTFIVSG